MHMDDKPEAVQYIHRLKQSLEANRESLQSEGNVPGTGVSMWDLLKVSGDLKKFHAECTQQLASGKDCTGDFNLRGGKSMNLHVSYDNGADVQIKSEAGAVRKVNIKPAPVAAGKAAP